MRKGYTFIELLVTITIIAILIMVATVSYQNINKSSRDTKRRSDVEQIRSALELYRADMGYYPDGSTSFSEITADTDPGKALYDEEYMTSIPSDPKDNDLYPYQIMMSDSRGSAPDDHYYGYCIAAFSESAGADVSTCSVNLPSTDSGDPYKYGVKNP